ncbi:hypothetical protein [Streptomyces albipurpureus]|uniref:Integral membrane protein n=1 Tax=Streptomyces albipurpureus TaxID=2897419 RepID=A0ABT0UFT6_9ACTN|nr:hypothetical protein [Streptomyces sp. CWNU-1]MCM2386915.1 hypothetical protein [Streptomyces sp. CWNU-1]
MSATLLTGIARTSEPQRMLRRFLLLDAVVTGVNGLVYAVAPGTVARLTGVDDGVLLGLGVFLLVFTMGVGALGAQRNPSGFSVKLLIEANALWAALSLLSPLLWFDPTLAGSVWIVLQALVVGGFAALQWAALGVRSNAVRA